MPVAFAPLDGGEVIPMASVTDLAVSANGTFTFNYEQAEELSVDGDGIVRFGFQSSHEPGAIGSWCSSQASSISFSSTS